MTATAPRVGGTLTTAEQLDALPDKAVVLDEHEEPWQKLGEGLWCGSAGGPMSGTALLRTRTDEVTVLYVPGEPSRPSVTDNARAEAIEAAARWLDRIYPNGLVAKKSVLADLAEWADRAKRGVHPSGREWAAGRAETTTEQKVHNHGPTEGRGLDCPETTLPDGRLRGACLARAEAEAALRATVDLDPRSDFDRGYAHGWNAAAEWAAGRAETTTGRCWASRNGGCSECHDEYGRHVRCRAETTTGAIARGEALAAGDPDWMNVTRWPQDATTTATTEDAARVLDDVIQHLRKIWSTGHDEAREVIDTAEELLAQALPRLLATARTRPTRDELAKVICESRCSPQRKSWLETADAVLALLADQPTEAPTSTQWAHRTASGGGISPSQPESRGARS